jgi:hypothetical protein
MTICRHLFGEHIPQAGVLAPPESAVCFRRPMGVDTFRVRKHVGLWMCALVRNVIIAHVKAITTHIHVGMSQTDKNPLALLDRNGRTSMAFLDNGILRRIAEDARRLRIQPQRLPRIPRKELRSLGRSVHRQALNVRLLLRVCVVEVEIDDMRGGHGPVGDARDDEAEDVVRESVYGHALRSLVEQTLQEVVAVVTLARDEVDQRVAQPAKGPYARLEFHEVGLDVPLEDLGDFLCVLSERPVVLGVNIEEDEPEKKESVRYQCKVNEV